MKKLQRELVVLALLLAGFFQALDAQGRAVQTMRSATHVQPGQTLSCTGCHDSRKDTPPPSAPLLASLREPSKITVGPEGSWTMRFDLLIEPAARQTVERRSE